MTTAVTDTKFTNIEYTLNYKIVDYIRNNSKTQQCLLLDCA